MGKAGRAAAGGGSGAGRSRAAALPPLALVLAVDEMDPARALDLVAAGAAEFEAVKLGVPALLGGGPAFAREARARAGSKVLLFDLKVADIGHEGPGGRWEGTNSKIIAAAAALGADLVTVHGLHGVAALLESAAAARDRGIGVLPLPFMTHRGAGLAFAHPLDRAHAARELEPFGLAALAEGCATLGQVILKLGEAAEVAGYVGPGNLPEVIADYRRFTRKRIWSPGFGRQDRRGWDLRAQLADFLAAAGPESAAILGTAVTGAPDPRRAAGEIRRMRDEVVKGECIM